MNSGDSSEARSRVFKTLGLSIEFPFEPYGTQRAMMNKIASTLMNKEHSLIESPTGTGKTLVLLCSSLAWLTKSKALEQPFISVKLRKRIIDERLERLKQRGCTCGRREAKSECDEIKASKMGEECCEFESSPYFKENSALEKQKCSTCLALEVEESYQEIMGEDSMDSEDVSHVRKRVPRIYYGTRTHKQITQVVRELNKTPYRNNLKMCILSSRERTCINEDVRDQSDRNDRCRELVNNKRNGSNKKENHDTCPFYSDSKLIAQTFETINVEFDDRAWDIEDAGKFGLKYKTCPYYGARSLQEQADLTLCPYNYLLDPTIRNNLNINLSNAIIIIDEAHNLEDICRDSASFIIDTKQIESILETLNIAMSHYVQGSDIATSYQYFKEKLTDLRYFLMKFQFQPQDKDPFDQSERRVLSEAELLAQLKVIGLGPESLKTLKENLKTLRGDDDEKDDKSSKTDDTKESALSTNQLQFIAQLVLTLEFMFSNSHKSLFDYRAVVTKNLERDSRAPHQNRHGRNSFVPVNVPTTNEIYIWQFSLLCMNPAVAFDKIHRSAWSVIVASGTLSPIESLKSELGCIFTQPFEGGHVISRDRIFATIVSHGPQRVELNCAYNNSLKLNFQDEVGEVVLDVCRSVPKGVLCFFPSYERMENFCQRWTAKGTLAKIEKAKGRIFKEQKKLTANEFERILERYNKRANGNGALLLAVFRGKVSEGIDFADNTARAVITIGIPYPNVREVTVDLKRIYNDSARSKRPQIMTGSDWYACQAFRALNQALGRCIRHKEDWGAVIMIDSRLKSKQSERNLSKWLHNNIISSPDYSIIKDSLEDFVRRRIPKVETIELSNDSFEDCF